MQKNKIDNFLKRTQRYTGTDNVYLAKGGFWLGTGQAVSAIAALLLSIAFANLLPRETYGTYRYVLSIFALLSISTLQGMSTAITRAVARGYEGSFKTALGTKLRWGVAGAAASLATSLYYYLQGNNTLAISFLIATVFVPIMSSFKIVLLFWIFQYSSKQ